MRCPECGHPDSRVIDSRTSGDAVRRRRECQDCSARFTTHERVEAPLLWIVKRDGRREPFDRDKVMRGIALACRKRPVDDKSMVEALEEVEAALRARREREIDSSVVGEALMHVLRDVDAVAYVRFASVYRAFDRVDEFIEIIRPLREQG